VPKPDADADGAVPKPDADADGAVPKPDADADGAVPKPDADADGAVPKSDADGAGPKADASPAADKAAKTKALLDQELQQRGLAEHPMFKDMDPQTQGKVNTALQGDPLRKVSEATQKAAQQWALDGAENNPREFANRYEYARAKFGAERDAAAIRLKGKPGAKAAAGAEAAAAITPDKLTSALDASTKSVEALGPGGRLEDLPANASPEEIAGRVQGLERLGYETPTAEAYHALKHQGELPPMANRTGDPVKDYNAAAMDTVRNGQVVHSGPAEGGSTRVVIRKEYGVPDGIVKEAIVYVKPDGTVSLATYGKPKWKP
jgi:hypothetical protein